MIALFLAACGTLGIIGATELIWRGQKHGPEFIRKFIHVGVGLFVAFWPWFLSWDQIEVSAIVFVLAITAIYLIKPLGRILSVSSSSHQLERRSVGDLFFTAGFLAVAFATHNRYIFMTALLHLTIADTLAGIVGKRYGQKSRYSIFGLQKSLVGTAAFFLSSIVLVSIFIGLTHSSWLSLLWVPLAATLFENIGVYGSDNLLVPFSVALLLRAVV